MNNQLSIFDIMYPKFKITKPIKLIELFGGYGSQFFALKYLGANVQHYKLVEWAAKSIQAYNDVHIRDYKNYSEELTDDEVIDKVTNWGVSLNYNEPATREQIKRQNYRKIYNNIIATNNLVDISRVNGCDLEINNKNKYEYIMTYSFPCQDLSLAGLGKGMSKDSGTRSGLLWQVERILDECKEINQLPQILLMENVPQVHGEGNTEDFIKWQSKLEQLGYKNYWKDLIATDYGIPQTRNRCFMISILGDYSYTFPQPIKLEKRLKDLLEDEVDEKYYLSDKQIINMENGKYNASKPSIKLEITDKGVCQTLDTMSGGNRQPLVKVGDFNLKTNNKGLIKTLNENDVEDGDYINSYNYNIQKGVSGTITTGVDFRNNSFIAINDTYLITKLIGIKDTENYIEWKEKGKLDSDCRAAKENKSALTITTSPKAKILLSSNLRIRKLTPKECFRLMGVKDDDYERISKNQSNASLYHLAGDSIVINVLMAIFKELL